MGIEWTKRCVEHPWESTNLCSECLKESRNRLREIKLRLLNGSPILGDSDYDENGTEFVDFDERRFNKTVLHGAEFAGEEESRQRKARQIRSYGSGRGYTCILCLEMFRSLVRNEADDEILEIEAKQQGTEILGTDFAHFLLKQDLEAHIQIIHGGRKEYWRRVNDAKRMAKIRELDSLNKEPSVNSNQKGKGEKQ